MRSIYLGDCHQKSEYYPPPNPLARPQLNKRNREPNAGKEQRLHQVLLHPEEVYLKGVHKGGAFIYFSFTFLARHDNERPLGVLAW